MKIGIFDSGMGGTTVLAAIKKLLPSEEYFYLADSKNCPYGEKTDEELQKIVSKNTEELINWGAKIIVIACNTATVKCINYLRKNYPNIAFVGTEPAIKLATNTNAKKILVLATPGTVKSERTHMLLKENQKEDQTITLLPCPGLADVIENKGDVDQKLSELFKEIDKNQDAVVLGCTHYPLVKSKIQNFFKNAILIDGSDGVARQVEKLLKTDYNINNE